MKEIFEQDLFLRGVDNQKIFFIRNRDLCAAVSATNTMQYEDTMQNNKIHEEVIEIFIKKYSILPFRFNSIVGERVGRGIIVKYYDELQENLKRIQNKVEYIVKAIVKESFNKRKLDDLKKIEINRLKFFYDADRTLLKKKILDVKTKVLSRQINKMMDEIASESFVDFLPNNKIILSGEYLVDKRFTDRFNKVLTDLQSLYPEIEFLSIGPRPPYCFNLIDITKDNTVKLKKIFRRKNDFFN